MDCVQKACQLPLHSFIHSFQYNARPAVVVQDKMTSHCEVALWDGLGGLNNMSLEADICNLRHSKIHSKN